MRPLFVRKFLVFKLITGTLETMVCQLFFAVAQEDQMQTAQSVHLTVERLRFRFQYLYRYLNLSFDQSVVLCLPD